MVSIQRYKIDEYNLIWAINSVSSSGKIGLPLVTITLSLPFLGSFTMTHRLQSRFASKNSMRYSLFVIVLALPGMMFAQGNRLNGVSKKLAEHPQQDTVHANLLNELSFWT